MENLDKSARNNIANMLFENKEKYKDGDFKMMMDYLHKTPDKNKYDTQMLYWKVKVLKAKIRQSDSQTDISYDIQTFIVPSRPKNGIDIQAARTLHQAAEMERIWGDKTPSEISKMRLEAFKDNTGDPVCIGCDGLLHTHQNGCQHLGYHISTPLHTFPARFCIEEDLEGVIRVPTMLLLSIEEVDDDYVG